MSALLAAIGLLLLIVAYSLWEAWMDQNG